MLLIANVDKSLLACSSTLSLLVSSSVDCCLNVILPTIFFCEGVVFSFGGIIMPGIGGEVIAEAIEDGIIVDGDEFSGV